MATRRSRRRTKLRVSAEKAEREKLNDERGTKPLPVSRSRDDCRTGKMLSSGRIGEKLLYSVPRNQRDKNALQTMLGREPDDMPEKPDAAGVLPT